MCPCHATHGCVVTPITVTATPEPPDTAARLAALRTRHLRDSTRYALRTLDELRADRVALPDVVTPQ